MPLASADVAMQRAWHREYNPSLEAVASCGTEPRTTDDILPSASEGAILPLTRGRALAYATPHSLWTPVKRTCKPYAPCYQGNGAGGAMLNVRAAVVVQRWPGVHAVDGSPKARGEG